MLTLPSVVVALALLLALAAYLRARSAVRRLERMTESYWELRYEVGQLKSRATRLEVGAGVREAEPEVEAPKAASPTSFVPLSSLKK